MTYAKIHIFALKLRVALDSLEGLTGESGAEKGLQLRLGVPQA